MGESVYKRDPRAIKLRAIDARVLLNAKLPFIVQKLTESEIGQIQKVLDAAVVNLAVQEEYQSLMEKSVTHKIAGQVNRDPRITREAEQVFRSAMRVFEDDKHIRIDYRKLLDPYAFIALSDNADERAYLEKVRHSLDKNGVWLHIRHRSFSSLKDYRNAVENNANAFQVWLSYGADIRPIYAPASILTRESVLEAVSVGKGYYSEVIEGPVLKAINLQILKLRVAIEHGMQEHINIQKTNRDAMVGVVKVSEFVSGADLPDLSIWENVNKFLTKAQELRNEGKLSKAGSYTIVGAMLAEEAARSLVEYGNKVSGGAKRVVKVLEVVATAAETTQLLISPTAKIQLIAKYGIKTAVKNGAKEIAEDKLLDAVGTKFLEQLEEKHPGHYFDTKIEVDKGPSGTVSGGRHRPRHGIGTGFNRWP